jgi:hypothetical protein
MGYMLVYGPCFICRVPFGFNATHVPSFPDEHGQRQPICARCMRDVNEIRRRKHLPKHPIHPDAYEPEEA